VIVKTSILTEAFMSMLPSLSIDKPDFVT